MSKIDDFDKADKETRYAANRLLFTWLSEDKERTDLYRCLREAKKPRVLMFQSRADLKERPTDPGNSTLHQDVCLLTARSHIEKALTDSDHFSNSPYQVLGGGTFMLGLDGADHARQRKFASAYIHVDKRVILALSTVAFMAGAALPLKQRQFDLAHLAEQVALRFVAFLFGFAQADHPLIEATMRKAYLGLNYQILGRHFVSEPGVIPDANAGMGALLQRVAGLIDLYRQAVGREQRDELKTIDAELKELRQFKNQEGTQPLEESQFVPVLRRIAEQKEPDVERHFSGNELAVIVVGLIAGTIGNVQASVSIAINEFLRTRCHDQWRRAHDEAARDEAKRAWLASHDAADDPDLEKLIWEALRLQPPVAFLPRSVKKAVELELKGERIEIKAGTNLILAIGAATGEPGGNEVGDYDGRLDPLVFGGPPGPGGFMHQCIGQRLAMPLVTHIVRQVLLLPGLAQSLDPVTGQPLGLTKLWGFNCQRYPLEFNRFEILKQSPLIVIMNVRTPVAEHAEALKKVITYGAPRIEKKLRDAGHVHFAQFLFIENDSKLVLFTIYDRDFDSYIEHFALEIGPLFDRLFEHIENPPPQPVARFPKEFVDAIRRHNASPAGDYFFSAYPSAEVSMIHRHFPPEGA
jgi:cytochrome P450